MCEYCGCQALDAIAILTAEHEEALNHIRTAERGLAAGTADIVVGASHALQVLLEAHTAVEEQALFPALAPEFPEQIAALHREHELVGAALEEAGRAAPADDFEHRLSHALRVLREHILKEQDGVFPAALSALSPAQWDRVDAVRSAQQLSRTVRVGGTEEALRA